MLVETELTADGRVECRIADQGHWLPPDLTATDRGKGLLIAGQMIDDLHVTHAGHDGAGGTVVTLRHRLHQPAVLASDASAHPVPHRSWPQFAADTETSGPVLLVRVRGVVDITTAEQFTARLLTACRGGVLPLTVDFTETRQLASAGVRALHQVRDQLAVHGHDLTIIAAPESSVAAVLDVVRLPHTTSAGTGVPPAAGAGAPDPGRT